MLTHTTPLPAESASSRRTSVMSRGTTTIIDYTKSTTPKTLLITARGRTTSTTEGPISTSEPSVISPDHIASAKQITVSKPGTILISKAGEGHQQKLSITSGRPAKGTLHTARISSASNSANTVIPHIRIINRKQPAISRWEHDKIRHGRPPSRNPKQFIVRVVMRKSQKNQFSSSHGRDRKIYRS